MGKVYDALRRAEEQRARRIQETRDATAAGLGAGLPEPAGEPRVDPSPAAPPRPRPGAGAPVSRPAARRARGGASRLASLWRRNGAAEAGALNKRRVALLQPESFVTEQFRTLRARIDSLAAERPIRTLAVTSAIAGEGKSMAAIGLATVSSMNVGRKVLLIDCDLRDPAVHLSLGLAPRSGIAELIRNDVKLEEAVLPVEGTQLEVLPVRSVPSNPSELLASQNMRGLLELAASRYDQVILDLPPVLGLPDAKEVSDVCDGTIFVVRAGVTQQDDVEAALEVLNRDRLIGLVLNGAELDPDRYAYGT